MGELDGLKRDAGGKSEAIGADQRRRKDAKATGAQGKLAERSIASLSGPNADGVVELGHKDLAVADAP